MAKKKAKKGKKNWIAGAIKKKGALRATAKKAGAVKGGKISPAWLQEKAKAKGTVGKRARLAITLGKMKRKRKKKR